MVKWARLFTPTASLALTAALVADASFALPCTTRVGRIFAPGRTCCRVFGPEAWMLREQGALTLVDVYDERSETIDMDKVEGRMYMAPRVVRRGLWAATRETCDVRVHIESVSALSVEDTNNVKAQFLELVERGPDFKLAPHIKAGDATVERPLISGYFHNVVVATVFGALAASLKWAPDRVRAIVRKRRASAGLCPSCAYDVRGLSAGPCPECGAGL